MSRPILTQVKDDPSQGVDCPTPYWEETSFPRDALIANGVKNMRLTSSLSFAR